LRDQTKDFVNSQKDTDLLVIECSAVEMFIKNRRAFYETLLPRLLHPRLRQMIADVVNSSLTSSVEALLTPSRAYKCDAHSAHLLLDDLLKKPKAGYQFGRLAISVHDCFDRIIEVEKTAFLLFKLLSEQDTEEAATFSSEAEKSRQILSKIATLQDDFRYHRLDLLSGE
jgi:hypothetical protein